MSLFIELFPILLSKKGARYSLLLHVPLRCFALSHCTYYANCIIWASISFNSSKDIADFGFYLNINIRTVKNSLDSDIVSGFLPLGGAFYTALTDNSCFGKGQGIHCFLRYVLP